MKQIQSKIILRSKILCLVALAALALTACQSAAVSETPKDASGDSTAKANAVAADAQTVLVDSLKSLQTAESWVADAVTSNDVAPQANAKILIRYSAPDRFQIETEAAGNIMQIISIGADTFLQINGKWQKAPASANLGQMIGNWREMFSAEKLRAFRNIRFVGKETTEGKELAVYTYEIDQQAAMTDEMKKDMTDEMKTRLAEVQAENTAKIWIDESSKLPSRMEMTMKMTKPQAITQKMAVNYRYDEAVNIEAPKLK